MYIACFIAYLFIVIVVIKAHINNYPYSVLFSTAVAVVIAAGLIDYSTRTLPVSGRYVNAFPILVFTLIEMLMLAKRYSSQYEIEQFYTEELNRTLEAMQDSENAFLNAQMKPHFLYNTLNTIADLCVTDSEKAKSLIASLKDYCYMILSIDNVDKTVPLSREMELVTAYTSIEKERFPSINFYTDLPIRMRLQYSLSDAISDLALSGSVTHRSAIVLSVLYRKCGFICAFKKAFSEACIASSVRFNSSV